MGFMLYNLHQGLRNRRQCKLTEKAPHFHKKWATSFSQVPWNKIIQLHAQARLIVHPYKVRMDSLANIHSTHKPYITFKLSITKKMRFICHADNCIMSQQRVVSIYHLPAEAERKLALTVQANVIQELLTNLPLDVIEVLRE